MDERPGTVTKLLRQWHDGDPEAARRLFPLVYPELKGLAESYLRRERQLSMCRTELVHELYLKLPKKAPEFENRSHFFGVAARLMRQILVDLARGKKRLKRQQPTAIPFSESGRGMQPVDVLALDQCLERLHELDPRKAQLVELKTFGGLTIEEMAEALNLSLATVKREWAVSKLWIRRELDRSKEIGESSSHAAGDTGGLA